MCELLRAGRAPAEIVPALSRDCAGVSAPLARAGVLVPFARFLDEAGVASWRLLEAARLPPEPETCAADFVPLVAVLRFGEIAARATGVEDIGAVVGLTHAGRRLGELGAAVRAAPTLRHALLTLIVAVRLYNSSQVVWVDDATDGRAALPRLS